MGKCSFPTCNEESQFKARQDLDLCQQHYALYQFIDKILFGTNLTINIHDYRFKYEKDPSKDNAEFENKLRRVRELTKGVEVRTKTSEM